MSKSIYQKLSAIQNRLIAPKGQRNDFGKYNYRSCEDIVQALKPLCDEEKCVVFMTNRLIQVGERVYVEAMVTLADLESEQSIISTAQAREEEDKKGMDGSQITGASSSYARKYALAGLFMIDNEKDSDATNDGKPEKKEAPKEAPKMVNSPEEVPTGLITPNQKAKIMAELIRTHVSKEQLCKMYKVATLDDIPEVRYEGIMKKFEKTPTYEEAK